ncbi:MAG: hypothetical protein IBJ00_04040 [Alphaproteobacteria bacterium]|nr:hypothetical protein [Alphaproteobacteria bacterium]
MKFNLSLSTLWGVLNYESNNSVWAKTDLNKILKQFGVQNHAQTPFNSSCKSNLYLSKAKKAEIRLINNFLDRLKLIKVQIGKQEK